MSESRRSISIPSLVWYLAAWWLWMPAIYGIVYLFSHTIASGTGLHQVLDQFMLAHFSGAALVWFWWAVGLLGSVLIWGASAPQDSYDEKTPKLVGAVLIISLILGVLSLGQGLRVIWDNDKDLARYYAPATTFYTASDTLPATLQRLKASPGSNGCLVGSHDVVSCVKKGSLDLKGWDARIGSLDGASVALTRRSGDVQRVSLNTSTLTYLNAWPDSEGVVQPARWSGILDGQGITVPLGGVAEWVGAGTPTECLFAGPYAIDRAFGGTRSNNLQNLLADRYPALRYNINDVWGYCDGEQPVVIVPVTQQVTFKNRTVDEPAGIIKVQGSNGKAVLSYERNVKADTYPGPVYPMTVAKKQREMSAWAAGRQNMDRNGFGFEPADSAAQAGNVSEYLLRNVTTGRMEYVTPLTLRHSTSQLIVAYSVVPADEITDGHLAPLSIYVLDDKDPRRINIDSLEADALQFLVSNAGTFKANGGKLVEFTPVDGQVWRAFGELNGQVVYQLDIDAAHKVPTRLVELTSGQTTTSGDASAPPTQCGDDPSSLTPTQLAGCISKLTTELAGRASK